MKTKLLRKLRKEAEKRYSIVVKGGLYMLYNRVEKKHIGILHLRGIVIPPTI
jgi:hypothetical protein